MMEYRNSQESGNKKKREEAPSSTVCGGEAAERKREATIAYLSQVEEINRRIALKKSKIEIKRDALSVRSPVLSDMPKAPSPDLQSMESHLCDILALEDEVKGMEQKMANLKARMMGMIEKLDSMDEQLVLIQCYLNLKPNRQAMEALHFSRGWYLKLKAQGIDHMCLVLEREGELQRWIS